MNKEIEKILISIISNIHKKNEILKMDDLEYIPLLKTIILGVEKGISDGSNKEVEIMKKKLFLYSRELYLKDWLNNGEEGEDIEQARQEGIEWFDYIYTNEEYPE
ncbi:hypothetical protein LR004_01220 [Candidatus Gracilibacteria bacterium]|nr:hypothetical protein [Candidatus Gracilibacteria bacterium]